MTVPIHFLTSSQSGGGMVAFLRMSLEYLAAQTSVVLIDEYPEQVLTGLSPVACERVSALSLPTWSASSACASPLWAHWKAAPPGWIVIDNPGILLKHRHILQRARRELGSHIQLTLHSGLLTLTLRRRLLEAFTSVALLSLDRVTCVSEYTSRYWKHKYPWTRRKVFDVIYNGVILPELSPTTLLQTATDYEQRALRVGFVGRLHPEKDPLLFCRIAEVARKQESKLEFHLFGDGPLQEFLQHQFAEVVTFHGHVSDPEAIYSSLDVLAVTSPVENCPYIVLEAKSRGLPAVAAAVGGIPEIVVSGQDGVLCSRRDAQSFLDAIKEVRGDYMRFRKHCLENRTRFSLENHAREMWSPLLQSSVRRDYS